MVAEELDQMDKYYEAKFTLINQTSSNMMKYWMQCFMCVILILFINTVFAQSSQHYLSRPYGDDFIGVEIKVIKVAPGIYMLMGIGGNIGVSVGDDGVFLIDDEFAELHEKIHAALQEISPEPVRFIINTHWHFDHAAGNAAFANEGAIIIAHDNVRKRMSRDTFMERFNLLVEAYPKDAWPVITFADSVTLHLNSEDIAVQHVPPAHTDGDSIIFFSESNVVHTGDIFLNGSYPFIDISTDGSIDGMITAAEYLLTQVDEETKIIPGHGELGDRDDLIVYIDVLKDSREKIAALIESGKTLEEIIATKPVAQYDEQWGQGFVSSDQFVITIYKSLGTVTTHFSFCISPSPHSWIKPRTGFESFLNRKILDTPK